MQSIERFGRLPSTENAWVSMRLLRMLMQSTSTETYFQTINTVGEFVRPAAPHPDFPYFSGFLEQRRDSRIIPCGSRKTNVKNLTRYFRMVASPMSRLFTPVVLRSPIARR